MHVYCVPRGVKRHGIVKEILMFALWSLDTELLENGAKFTHWMSQDLNAISFLWIDYRKCSVKKQPFSKIYKLNAI